MATSLDVVEIDNRLLATDARAIVDRAVRETFGPIRGEWRITVSEVKQFSPPWWWVAVRGLNDVFEMCLRLSEQDASVMRDRLLDVLRVV